MSRGGTPLYKPYRYVPPRRIYIYFLFFFWSENGSTFCPFWSGIGYRFRWNYGIYYFSSKMNTEKGRVIYKFEVDRVTIWRARRHTPQGAHTICVCNHNLKISNLCGSKISLFCTQKVHWVQTPFCLENTLFLCNDCS